MKRSLPAAVLTALATALSASIACAQVLDEVVVTAQKREQSAQDVGISMTVLSGDQVRELGLTTTSELGAMTPGLLVTEFGNTPTVSVFTIRGVSQNDFSDHNEVPNAVYLDGAYISFVGAIGSQMYDVERIEVLRGPQGTLFGRNATGGLVQIVSRRPTDNFEAYSVLTYAEHDQIKFEGAISGPVTSTLSGRLSIATDRHRGFIENRIGNDGGEDNQYNVRAQLLWKPSEETSALLSLRGARVDNISSGGYDIRPGTPNFANDGLVEYVPPGAVNPTCALYFGIPAPPGQTDCFGYTEPDSDPYTASFDSGRFDRKYYGTTLTVDHLFSGANLTWITDGQWIKKGVNEDTDSTPIPVLRAIADQDAHQFSTELRVSGERDALHWVVGGYYLDIDGDYAVGVDSVLFGLSVRNNYFLKTRSEALFAQIDYALTPAWSITGGARYTWDHKDFDYRPGCTGPGCFLFETPGSAQLLGLVADQSHGDVSAKFELDWQPSKDLLVYLSATRGTKAGGFSGPIIGSQPPADLPYGPEVLNDYETGFKWTLPGGKTRLNAGVFFYDYHDYQDYDTKNISQVITNKDAEVRGGELELASTPVKGLDLLLGVSVLDATVFDITLPSGRVADRKMPQAPSVSVTGLLRKEWTFGRGYVALQGDAKYVGARYFRSINYPIYHEDAYTVANARVSFGPADRRWELAVFAKNLTDTAYRVWSFEDLAVNGVVNDNYGMPRWFGVTASMRW